jgi:quercetin dioxygenase-like cupin family protein
MSEELLYEKGNVLVRRVILEKGESSPWHSDACDRVTVILSGDRLAIEFQDSGETHEFDLRVGQVDWDGATPEVHRAINVGRSRYEEVVTFFLSEPGQDPQPKAM